MPKVSVVDFCGLVFREPFLPLPPVMLTPLLEWELPSFTDPSLLGNVDWLSDGYMIQIGQLESLDLRVLNLRPRSFQQLRFPSAVREGRLAMHWVAGRKSGYNLPVTGQLLGSNMPLTYWEVSPAGST